MGMETRSRTHARYALSVGIVLNLPTCVQGAHVEEIVASASLIMISHALHVFIAGAQERMRLTAGCPDIEPRQAGGYRQRDLSENERKDRGFKNPLSHRKVGNTDPAPVIERWRR